MKEPVDHILRPQLPWRNGGGITECGYNADKVPTLTRDQYIDRVKDMGQQRAAMFTCMTCAQTASRWGTWEEDPRQAVQREIEWEGHGRWRNVDRGLRMKDELLAIAALIEAHRDEFDSYVLGTEQRREWLAKKAASASGKISAKPRRTPW